MHAWQDFGWGPVAGFTIFFGLVTLAIPVLRLSGARWPLSVVFSVVWALIVADATHDFLLRIELTVLASIAAAIACITVHRVVANEWGKEPV